VIGTLWLAEGLFSDQPPRYPMAGDALPRAHLTPLGEMPGPGLAGFTTLDILVHGWDLAVATEQPADLDGRVAAHVLGFAGPGRRHRRAPGHHAAGGVWHLKVLREAGLVDERREGTRHLFAVNPDGFAAVQEFLASFWAEHLGRLRAALTDPGEEPGQRGD